MEVDGQSQVTTAHTYPVPTYALDQLLTEELIWTSMILSRPFGTDRDTP